MISSWNVIAVVRGIAVEKDDETPSGVGNAARRVFAGGGTVTVNGGSVSYWIIVLVSVSAMTIGGSSLNGWVFPSLLHLRARDGAKRAVVP